MKNSNFISKELNLSYFIKEILTLKEATSFLGISTSMMYKLTHTKAIPYYKPNGKLIYFKKSELNDWILRNRVSSVDEMEKTFFNQF